MARKNKVGLDYFPLSVDMDEEDERIYMMEAELGWRSFAVVIKLLMFIYRRGYYELWTEREQLFFSRKGGIPSDYCQQVIDFCVQKGFFCKHLFDKYHILTSRGIQKRYFEAVIRRKEVPFFKEFLLLDPASEINVNIVLRYVDINTIDARINNNNGNINSINDSKSTQRRGEESRGEEKREEKKKGEEILSSSNPKKPETLQDTDNEHLRLKRLRAEAEYYKIHDEKAYLKLLKQHPEIEEEVPWT